jgi:hypothetical protein
MAAGYHNRSWRSVHTELRANGDFEGVYQTFRRFALGRGGEATVTTLKGLVAILDISFDWIAGDPETDSLLKGVYISSDPFVLAPA